MSTIGNIQETSKAGLLAAEVIWDSISPGVYPVTVTATSPTGLVTTTTVNVEISGVNDTYVAISTASGVTTAGTFAPSLDGSLINGNINTDIPNILTITSGSVTTSSNILGSIEDITMVTDLVTSGNITGTVEDITMTTIPVVIGNLSSTLEDIFMFSGPLNEGTLSSILEDIVSNTSGAVITSGSISEILESITSDASGTSYLAINVDTSIGDITSTGNATITMNNDNIVLTMSDIEMVTEEEVSRFEVFTGISYLVYLIDR